MAKELDQSPQSPQIPQSPQSPQNSSLPQGKEQEGVGVGLPQFINATKRLASGQEEAVVDIQAVEWSKHSGIWRSDTGWTPASIEDALVVEKFVAQRESKLLQEEETRRLEKQLSPLEYLQKSDLATCEDSTLQNEGDQKFEHRGKEKGEINPPLNPQNDKDGKDDNIEYVDHWYYSPTFRKVVILCVSLLASLAILSGIRKAYDLSPKPNPLAESESEEAKSLMETDLWVTNESPAKLDKAATLKLLTSSILESVKLKAALDKGYSGPTKFEEIQPYLTIYGNRLAQMFIKWANIDGSLIETELQAMTASKSPLGVTDGRKNKIGMHLTGLGEYPSREEAIVRWNELEEILEGKKDLPPKEYGFNIFAPLGEGLEEGTLDSYKMSLLESWARVRNSTPMPMPLTTTAPTTTQVGENWGDLSSTEPLGSKENPEGANLPDILTKFSKPSFIPPEWTAAEENANIKRATLAAIIQDIIMRAKAKAVIEKNFSGRANFKDFKPYLYLDPKIVNFYCQDSVFSRSSLESQLSKWKSIESPLELSDGDQNGVNLHLTSWGQYPERKNAEGWLLALSQGKNYRNPKASVNNQKRAIERTQKSGSSIWYEADSKFGTKLNPKTQDSLVWGSMQKTKPVKE